MRKTPIILFAGLLASCSGCGEHTLGGDASGDGPECASDLDCDDSDPCTLDACGAGACTHGPVDADGDGFAAAQVDGVACAGTDCDDSRADALPGGTEVCLDGVDQDCDGLVDGPVPIIPEVRISDGYYPTIARGGDAIGIAWRDDRDGNDEIYFEWLPATGSPPGTEERISDFAGWSSHPSAAWTGTGFGVAWHDGRDGTLEIYFARVSTVGARIGVEHSVTMMEGGDSKNPSLVWAGSVFGLAWENDETGHRNIYFRAVDAGGMPVVWGGRITSAPSEASSASLAWTGSEFGLSWQGADTDGPEPEIHFTRLAPDGSTVGTSVRVTSTLGPSLAFTRSLAWTGSGFGLAWAESSDLDKEIRFARLSATGSVIGSYVRITDSPGESSSPSLAWTGSEFLLLWDDDRTGNSEIWAVRVSAAGEKVGTETRVTNAAEDSQNPIVEWAGSTAGLVWADTRDGTGSVYYTLLGMCD